MRKNILLFILILFFESLWSQRMYLLKKIEPADYMKVRKVYYNTCEDSSFKYLNKLDFLDSLQFLQIQSCSKSPSLSFKNKYLKELFIDNSKIDTLFNIYLMNELKSFVLKSSNLSYFPDNFRFPPNLEYCNLSSNNLEIVNICNTSDLSLISLDLSYNNIKKISCNELYMNKLRILNLGNNKLVELPESICKLFFLESLYINNNNLKYLPESIGKLVNLKNLDISENELSEHEISKILILLPNCNVIF